MTTKGKESIQLFQTY